MTKVIYSQVLEAHGLKPVSLGPKEVSDYSTCGLMYTLHCDIIFTLATSDFFASATDIIFKRRKSVIFLSNCIWLLSSTCIISEKYFLSGNRTYQWNAVDNSPWRGRYR